MGNETYQPKVGDRVRVTCEGKVTDRASRNGSVDDGRFQLTGNVEIEKLPDPDPEPTWVNGDVIRARGTTWARMSGTFRDVSRYESASHRLITHYWNQGCVEILYQGVIAEPSPW